MAYATAIDMSARFPQTDLIELTNQNDPDAVVINEAVIQIALDDANAAIDAILGKRMRTPVTPAPSILVSVCCDIARYRLYAGKSTDEVEKRYDNAIKLLNNIGDGDLNIGAKASATPIYSMPDTVFVGKDFL